MPMIWRTLPDLSVIAPSASSAGLLSPVAEGPFRRRIGRGQYSTPQPSGRLLPVMGCFCCVRLHRSCSRCTGGPAAATPHSCSATGQRSKMQFETQPGRVGLDMRKPRLALSWSTRRLHRHAAYCNYMASQQWFALRERWAADWVEKHGSAPHCLICGVECDDLHHRTYERLGNVALRDLIPLCRGCHGVLHRMLETDRSWRRLNRAQATDLIVVTLRRKAHKRGVGHWVRKTSRA